MHRTEADRLDRCWICGEELDVERDRGYAFGNTLVLCHACAESRGGVFDERLDRWAVAPDLAGLPGEIASW